MPEGQGMCNHAYHEDKQNLTQPYTFGACAPVTPPKAKSRALKSGVLNRNTKQDNANGASFWHTNVRSQKQRNHTLLSNDRSDPTATHKRDTKRSLTPHLHNQTCHKNAGSVPSPLINDTVQGQAKVNTNAKTESLKNRSGKTQVLKRSSRKPGLLSRRTRKHCTEQQAP